MPMRQAPERTVLTGLVSVVLAGIFLLGRKDMVADIMCTECNPPYGPFKDLRA